MKINNKPKIAKNQVGMASILISLIMMLVISLIVLGFTQITRHEQKAALTKILSTQALYAAESGINDAQNIIETDIINGVTNIPAKTSCATSKSDTNYPLSPVLDTTTNIQYTCLLVNPTPQSLFYSPITDQDKIITVQSSSVFNQLMISWQNTDSTGFSCSSTYPQFPPQANWQCSAGVLRVEIVPINNPGEDLVVFLYPSTGSQNQYGTVNYTDHGLAPNDIEGSIFKGYCDASKNAPNNAESMPQSCNVLINNMNSSSSADGGYYLRIRAIYGNQDVTITAPAASSDITCIAGPSCSFDDLINDQVLVDSTGQAQNVLKRIQARVPDNPLDSSQIPDAAIQSSSTICKQFFVTNNSDNGTYGVSDASPTGCSF